MIELVFNFKTGRRRFKINKSIFIQNKILIFTFDESLLLFKKTKKNRTMNNQQKHLQTLQTIHIAMLMGQVMLALALFFLRNEIIVDEQNTEFASTFKLVVPVIALGGLLGGFFVFKMLVSKARGAGDVFAKLAMYRSAFLVRAALLEGSALLAIVAFYLTKDLLFMGVAIVLIFIFAFLRPTASGVIQDLELSGEEREVVNRES